MASLPAISGIDTGGSLLLGHAMRSVRAVDPGLKNRWLDKFDETLLERLHRFWESFRGAPGIWKAPSKDPPIRLQPTSSFQKPLLENTDADDSRKKTVSAPAASTQHLLPTRLPQHVLTVVFDLDETLISHTEKGVRKLREKAIARPGVQELLKEIRKTERVEVVLWTASNQEVAMKALGDTKLYEYFHHAITRDTRGWAEQFYNFPCEELRRGGYFYLKKMELLGRDLGSTVMFDNSWKAIHLNPKNAVLVEDFEGELEGGDTCETIFEIVRHILGGLEQDSSDRSLTQYAWQRQHDKIEFVFQKETQIQFIKIRKGKEPEWVETDVNPDTDEDLGAQDTQQAQAADRETGVVTDNGSTQATSTAASNSAHRRERSE